MPLIPLADAQTWVLEHCRPLPPAELVLADALGCVLAEDVVADEAVPPFANTAMDGFAVRAADTARAPVELEVVATLAAGGSPGRAVGPGEAIRIMTGAPIPPGADAVVPVEDTGPGSAGGERVRIDKVARVGDSVRPAGEDVAAGQLVFAAGTVLQAGHLGVLASIGLRSVRAVRRARVGVLSTGDELVEPPAPLRVGQIRDSNRHTLLALLRQANCEAVDLGLVRDDEAAIEAAVKDGVARCDALVTSGGVSVGDFDYIKVVLDRLSNGAMRWIQVAIRPAKPFAFGVIDATPVFGLPGNPVSSMVSFELFARPALRLMAGHRSDTSGLQRPEVKAVADEAFRRSPDGKVHFVRVVARMAADGRYHVASSGGQGSNLLRSMALANALAVVDDGDGVPAGGEVPVLLLGPPA